MGGGQATEPPPARAHPPDSSSSGGGATETDSGTESDQGSDPSYGSGSEAAYCQVCMCELEACVCATHMPNMSTAVPPPSTKPSLFGNCEAELACSSGCCNPVHCPCIGFVNYDGKGNCNCGHPMGSHQAVVLEGKKGAMAAAAKGTDTSRRAKRPDGLAYARCLQSPEGLAAALQVQCKCKELKEMRGGAGAHAMPLEPALTCGWCMVVWQAASWACGPKMGGWTWMGSSGMCSNGMGSAT